ncbi:class I SAM-dependent methyltransferase [Streptomyces sp. NPDC051172]|uniref:class I SAM-dependent methyltransferase n=1 Tax=Streptomyces sp. NPDC051172 TaxID=3155796 RepID=UPI00343CBC31
MKQTHTSAAGFPTYFAVRTRCFDDEILAGLGAGIRQVVTLAAGVDGRTVRLDLPAGSRWFEVEPPELTEFKGAPIARCGLPLACELTAQPMVRPAEGLLMYLTDDPRIGHGQHGGPASRLPAHDRGAHRSAVVGEKRREKSRAR